MRTRNRLIGWLILCCGVATFRFGPGILGLEDAGRQAWLAVPGVILPLVAALACYRAAKLSFAGDRKAWRNFSVASALYLLGNLCYLYYTLADVQLLFPTWPELSFLVMAIFFTIGMFQYGSGQYLISRIHRPQQRCREVGILHQYALGELKLEGVCIEPGIMEDIEKACQKPVVAELPA